MKIFKYIFFVISLFSLFYILNIDASANISSTIIFSNNTLIIENVDTIDEEIVEEINAYAVETHTLVIDDSVTSICKGAFSKFVNLQSITLPFIGDSQLSPTNSYFGYIFDASSYKEHSTCIPIDLKIVKITNEDMLEDNAFNGCNLINEITLPSTLINIGNLVFSGCSSLENINLPISIENYGQSIFVNCSNLKNVYFEGDLADWCSIDFINSYSNPLSYADKLYVLDENGNYYVLNELSKIEVPNTIDEIGAFSFYNFVNLEYVSIPNTIVYIGESTFRGCELLKELTIPSSVTRIGSHTLFGCYSLEKLTIPFVGLRLDGTGNTHFGYIFGASSYQANATYVPASLKTLIITGGKKIGAHAFENCIGLTNITIPSSIEFIGESAFNNCEALENVYFNGEIEDWLKFNFVEFSNNPMSNAERIYFYNENEGYYEPTELIIPININEIRDYQFYGFSKVKNIVLHDEINYLGYSSFEKCAVENISIPFIGSNINDYDSCFGYIFGAKIYEENKTKIPTTLKKVEITQAAVINKNAFYGCDTINEIIIPKTLIEVGESAFDACASLEKVYYRGDLNGWINITFDNMRSNPMYYADKIYFYNGVEFEEVKEITIPSNIYTIPSYQFYNFSDVKEVNIHENVSSIGEFTFFGCNSINKITIPFLGSSETVIEEFGYLFGESINIPTSLEEINILKAQEIGINAFNNCVSVKVLKIPGTLKMIGDDAFLGCVSLEEVYYYGNLENWCNLTFSSKTSNPMYYTSDVHMINSENEYYKLIELEIPQSVKRIGDYQFYGFQSLEKVNIHSLVNEIGFSAFEKCENIEEIKIPFLGRNNSSINNYLGYLFGADNYNSNKDYVPSTLASVTITGGDEISEYAFYGCEDLKNIHLSKSIKKIGFSAFKECIALESMTVPFVGATIDSPTYFGYLFGANEKIGSDVSTPEEYIPQNLTDLVILDGNKLYEGTFKNFTSLVNITLPSSISEYQGGVFSNCTSLENVYYNGTISDWSLISFANSVSTPMHYANKIYMLNNEGILEELIDLNIPEGITKIPPVQFYGFRNVKTITVPSTVVEIGAGAFYYCISVESVIIDKNVDIINACLSHCDNIKFLSIPFAGKYKVLDEATHFGKIFGAKNYLENVDSVPASLEKVEITGAEIIYENTFYECNNIKEIIISDTVTEIRKGAFEKCSSIQKLTIPFIGDSLNPSVNCHFSYIFGSPIYNYSATYVPVSLKEVVVTGGDINDNAFTHCEMIENVVIPNTATKIGNHSFYNCKSLKEINIPETIKEIGIYSFYSCWRLKEVVIPKEVTKIGEYAFYHCSNLKTLSIPFVGVNCNTPSYFYKIFGNLQYIPETLETVIITGDYDILSNAFSGCYNIKTIDIQGKTKEIRSNVFKNCTGLETLILPSTITYVGENILIECYSLKNIYFNGMLIDWCKIDFYDETANPSYYTENCFILNDSNQYYCLQKEKEIIVPSIDELGHYILYNCNSLEYLTIPYVGLRRDGVGLSDFSAIFGLGFVPQTLKELTILGGKEIGSYSFSSGDGVTSIEVIKILGETKKIRIYAFSGCESLKTIYLPDSIVEIHEYSFSECHKLENVYYNGLLSNWCKIDMSGDKSNPVANAHKLNLINEDGEYYELTEIHHPKDINNVKSYIYHGLENITTAYIPSSVMKLYGNAFLGCKNLKFVYIDSKDVIMSYSTNYFPNECMLFINANINPAVYSNIITDLYKKSGTMKVNDTEYVLYSMHTLEHSPYKSADCYNEGCEEYYSCKTCNISTEYNIIPITEHNYEFSMIPSTCLVEGYEGIMCSICKDKKEGLIIPTIDHNYSNWHIEEEPTCVKEGTKAHYFCDICELHYDENYNLIDNLIIPTIDHNYSNWHIEEEPTCVKEGTKGYYYCDICELHYDENYNLIDNLIIPTLDHNYSNWHIEEEPTCIKEGIKGYYYCDICEKYYDENYNLIDNLIIPTIDHNYSNWHIEEEPTCVKEGTKAHYYCDICEKYYDENYNLIDNLIIPTIDHNYSNWHIEEEATCVKEGTKAHYYCDICELHYDENYNLIDNLIIPKLNHEFSLEYSYNEVAHWHECECGEKTTSTNHVFTEWKVIKQATPKEKGQEERNCVCGYKEYRDIPKLKDKLSIFSIVGIISGGLCVMGVSLYLVLKKKYRK